MKRFYIISIFILIAAVTAFGQVPNTVSYQGLLTTTSGAPLPDGSYKLQFELFIDSIGGISFWTEIDSGLAVSRGTFSVILGAQTALPDSFRRPLYVQVSALAGPGIGSPLTFAPRQALTSSPYALSLKLPFTGRIKAGYSSSIFTIYNDTAGIGSAILGRSQSLAAYGGAVSGITTGFEGNGLYGQSRYGVGAWGVFGFTDSGSGVAGVATKKNGYGVYGYNSLGGAGIGVYSYGKLKVDAPDGDSSVQLPANSISSNEILDAPGISQGIILSSSVIVPTTGGMITIDSTTMTLPADGYVVVEASGQAAFSGVSGANTIALQIDDAPGSSTDGLHYHVAGSFLYPNTAYNFMPVTMRHTFYETKGTHTFWFKAGNYSASVGAYRYIWNPVITAMYFPKSYGVVGVIMPPSEASKFNSTSAITSSQGGQQTTSAGYAVDLRELEMKALKAREEAERAQREYMDARNAKAKKLINDDNQHE